MNTNLIEVVSFGNRRVLIRATATAAILGDTLRAQAFADDTLLQNISLPMIHALLALNRNDPRITSNSNPIVASPL